MNTPPAATDVAQDEELTTRQVCELLDGIHVSTVSRLVDKELLGPHRKFPGRTGPFLFLRSEVERYRRERMTEQVAS